MGISGGGDRFYFLGLQNHCGGDYSHEIQRCLLPGKKAMANLDSILKSKDITLLTKVQIIKAMVFFSSHVWKWLLDHKEGCGGLVAKSLTRVLMTSWTIAHQAPLSMGFSRQEYWSGLPFPSPGDFPDSGIKPRSPALQADSLLTELPGLPEEGWVLKNWCLQIVGLKKTLESPLEWKEIRSVNPKGNQPWMFIGRADAEAEAPILWPPDAKSWLTGKDPEAGKDWRQKEKMVTENEMVREHHQFNDMNLNNLWEIVENREDWHAAVHGVTKSWIQLSD